jgi:Flp pilus assembly protein TadB
MEETRTTTPETRDASIGELLGRLARDSGTLVRQEMALARAELKQKARAAGPAAGMFGAAYVIGMLAATALTAAIVLLLALVMPAWLAATIVAVIYAIVAWVLVRQGQRQLREAMPPVPEQTVETIKEDVEWVKSQKRSGMTSNTHGSG